MSSHDQLSRQREPGGGRDRGLGERDRDSEGRARQARPGDRLGRPLSYGIVGVEPVSDEPLPPFETTAFAHVLLVEGRPFSAHEVFEAQAQPGRNQRLGFPFARAPDQHP